MGAIGWTLAIGLLALCTGCPPAHQRQQSSAGSASDGSPDGRAKAAADSHALGLPPREPGPPRNEPAAEVRRERREAERLIEGLRGSVSARQLTSMADIRGYRLYRERRYQRAQAWFETAAQTDPSYEPSLYNAARVAALLGQRRRARVHLSRLRTLATPLARRALAEARQDPDMKGLFAD